MPTALKSTKAEVDYQTEPMGVERCGKCSMFRSPMSCSAVVGRVNADGWCRLWERRMASRQ